MKKMQKMVFKNLNQKQQNEYVDSFLSDKKRIRNLHVAMERMYLKKHTEDTLAHRQRGYYVNHERLSKIPSYITTPLDVAKGQWIGVEIECYIDLNMLCIMAHKLRKYNKLYNNPASLIEDYTKWDILIDILKDRKIKYVNYKEDGSLDEDREFAVEFTILTRIGAMSNLKALCDLLSELNADVDDRCGMHIHLDCKDLISKDVISSIEVDAALSRAKRLDNALSFLSQLVPKARRHNERYCRMGMSPSPHSHDDRYYAINTVSLGKFRTIEVRLHQGTTNYNKIAKWIELCYLISRNSKFDTYSPISNEDFYNSFTDFPQDLKEYCEERINKFKPELVQLDLDTSVSQGRITSNSIIIPNGTHYVTYSSINGMSIDVAYLDEESNEEGLF